MGISSIEQQEFHQLEESGGQQYGHVGNFIAQNKRANVAK